MTATASTYPEHDKLSKVAALSQGIGEFLEWLQAERGLVIAQIHRHEEYGCHTDCSRVTLSGKRDKPGCERCCHLADGDYISAHTGTQDLLAAYFEIDRSAIEREKRALLEAIRTGAPH